MMSLGETAGVLGAALRGADAPFEAVSTDSRTLPRGALFVALRGEHFDGHRFLDAARAAGAAGAIVDARYDGAAPLPLVVVEDTRCALCDLARHWRARFSPVLIALAGSNGKTTTKEMLAAILRAHAGEAAVLATAGNLNTDIGVSLTLLGLRAAHRVCAIELGTNHRGEIARVAGIAQPTIAVVTNALRDHLEFLGSVEEMAEENADALRALPQDGIAVVNADDAHAGLFRRAAGTRRVVDFGLETPATVSGTAALAPLSSEVEIRTPAGEVRTRLSIPGLHSVRNALAAAACAVAAGVAPAAIGAGLAAFRPALRRLQVKPLTGGATLLDDSYNANPDSVRAAIDVLAGCPGPTVLVLGDMGELGPQGAHFHREVGAYARARGISRLVALGEATRASVEAFGAGARHAASIEAAAEAARGGATILVKGSLFMGMDRVVAALTGEPAEAH
ncbi:MAG: UDP-N-acetylmuramoyl-tripeptide--D-alanyl-D-alanine ligase [Burkholderiales bacterium]|nr:UDP-N-acetylmuramoyl-tripeptide--D-alanyl-D-alanine ligase [Burkholderiales bacterium]